MRWLDQSSKAKYLARFQEDIFALMKRQINYHMGKMRKTNDLYDEVLEHAMQCQRLHERYFPRENLLKQVKTMVGSQNFHRSLFFRFETTFCPTRENLVSSMENQEQGNHRWWLSLFSRYSSAHVNQSTFHLHLSIVEDLRMASPIHIRFNYISFSRHDSLVRW